MRSLASLGACFTALLGASCAASQANITKPHSSAQILPSTFRPPQHFENVNLVRSINLEKGYVRETTNLVVQNIDTKPQTDYYLPFEDAIIAKIGGIEVRDKKDASKAPYEVSLVEFDPASPTQFYQIRLSPALAPKDQITLAITFSTLSSLSPLPTTVGQTDKHYLTYSFSAVFPSSYKTLKQKTKLKLPGADVPDYTVLSGAHSSENSEDPVKQGSTLTYGTFGEVPAGASEAVSVRYEFTKPVNFVSSLERDLEVSHWGGNLATEERYMYENRAAALKGHFNRVQWAASNYYNPATMALKTFSMPLRKGSSEPYFIDDIGNISTSNFRPAGREPLLELHPRYPVFGGWRFKFKVGWNADLAGALRKLEGDQYVLKIPFLEGPKQAEGISYEQVKVRIVLPEGATNVRFDTGTVPIVSSDITLHRTFMDTTGRTTLTLLAVNLVDELRGRDLVVTYDYPWVAGLRKPLTLLAGIFAVFTAAYLLSHVDVSIGRKET
ncbi:hypothetical protein FH972_023133 [Carpinus fangiana]|uniref:Dolichyl-diphosphooligosaccharide--protein glycosyltransferase subunit 1 n=1 Tax=Carpinus fangiana TaxID=176857 RepID=A0A5N6KUJ9_9ROSI|nr:hypothetical protein FH972_023133 [Carpinus fangiana]